eukprot:1048831-Pelagomonas_calceolata.AAC.1
MGLHEVAFLSSSCFSPPRVVFQQLTLLLVRACSSPVSQLLASMNKEAVFVDCSNSFLLPCQAERGQPW